MSLLAFTLDAIALRGLSIGTRPLRAIARGAGFCHGAFDATAHDGPSFGRASPNGQMLFLAPRFGLSDRNARIPEIEEGPTCAGPTALKTHCGLAATVSLAAISVIRKWSAE